MEEVKSKTITTEWSGSIDRAFVEFFQILGHGIFALGVATGELFKTVFRHPIKSLLVVFLHSAGTYYLVINNFHLLATKKFAPAFFYELRNYGIFRGGDLYHFGLVTVTLFVPLLLLFGLKWMYIRAKEEKIFKLAKLKNVEDRYPTIVRKIKNSKNRITLVINPRGLGVTEFENKKDQLEGLFQLGRIEDIRRVKKDQAKLSIIFSKVVLPKLFKYSELDRGNIPKDHFLIGHTNNGLYAQSIAELPHMLIAGMTGSGKSVFFKQALMSLLESTPNIKMYLIDLKGGLEMSDFRANNKVKIISKVDEAVDVLQEVKNEMLQRFQYLKKAGRKKINPDKDSMPRIIVGIDECSVLYMKKNKGSADYHHSIAASEITDDIAKLSRAAGIHLILATQKVTKETISTSIQDNIAGKVCFKMSGNSASILVLGNKMAEQLPQIQGRAIWHYGQEFVEFQAPYIEDKYIQTLCKMESINTGNKSNIIEIDSGVNNQEKEDETKNSNTQDIHKKINETDCEESCNEKR